MGLPKLALAPLLILWFGIGLFSKIIFVASLVFFLIFFNTLAGVKSVQPTLVSSARVLGARHWTIAREIVWNTALPYIFAGVAIVTALVIVLNAGLQKLHTRSMAWRPVSRDMVI